MHNDWIYMILTFSEEKEYDTCTEYCLKHLKTDNKLGLPITCINAIIIRT